MKVFLFIFFVISVEDRIFKSKEKVSKREKKREDLGRQVKINRTWVFLLCALFGLLVVCVGNKKFIVKVVEGIVLGCKYLSTTTTAKKKKLPKVGKTSPLTMWELIYL